MSNDLKGIRLCHALVFSSTIEDFERLREIISRNEDIRLIYEKHSASYLKIVEDRGQFKTPSPQMRESP